MGESDRDQGFEKLKLVRRTTFVDSRAQREEGFLSLRKSQTFVSSRSTGLAAKAPLPSILFRRHLGEADPLVQQEKLDEHHVRLSRYRGASFDRPAKQAGGDLVLITDTFSTGFLLASMLNAQGFQVCRVLSADLKDLMDLKPAGVDCEFIYSLSLSSELKHDEAIQQVLDELLRLPFPIAAVIAGAETGVELADEISERLGVRTNGVALSEARRNKYVMGETVRSAGVRAVKQLRATTWVDIAAFLEAWQPSPFQVIVKPLDSAGSDDVTLCHDLGEVQAAFGNIMGKINGLGLVNAAVLVQEYLDGQEYVIDAVSLDGVHKIVAIWAYDRRPANGAHFVCHGQRLLTADEPCCRELIDYQKRVLDALGIRNGPTHGEIKWCRGEPVLVEVGARCHGGDGFWTDVCDEVYGCNQAQATIDCYMNPSAFARLPDMPLQRRAFGCLKWLISFNEGTLKGHSPEAMHEMCTMSSYRGHQFFREKGEHVQKTQTCFTWAGCVKLANASEQVMEIEYKRCVSLPFFSLPLVSFPCPLTLVPLYTSPTHTQPGKIGGPRADLAFGARGWATGKARVCDQGRLCSCRGPVLNRRRSIVAVERLGLSSRGHLQRQSRETGQPTKPRAQGAGGDLCRRHWL